LLLAAAPLILFGIISLVKSPVQRNYFCPYLLPTEEVQVLLFPEILIIVSAGIVRLLLCSGGILRGGFKERDIITLGLIENTGTFKTILFTRGTFLERVWEEPLLLHKTMKTNWIMILKPFLLLVFFLSYVSLSFSITLNQDLQYSGEEDSQNLLVW
jgi:hypothetical protein